MATKSKRSNRVQESRLTGRAGRRAGNALRTGAAHAAGRASAVDRRTAVRRIRDCLGACGTDAARQALRELQRAARHGATALDAAVARCLELADGAGRDRWPLAEAAAWGLARLVAARRADGSAGLHLERLMAEARCAAAALDERDTSPARFVIVLSRLFADVEACRGLDATVTAAVVEEIGRLVTADGVVVLADSAAVVDRVDRWTRVRAAAHALDSAAWDEDLERRWAAAAAWTLRLLGAGGRGLGGDTTRTTASFVPALEAAGRGTARRTARMVRRGRKPAARRGRRLPLDHQDATAATAVIRTDWGRDAVRVLVDWRAAAPRVEIAAGDRLLVAGAWDWTTTVGGRPLDADGAWSVSAWESDRKAAFLEITAPLSGGMRLEREVVVLRRQRIVLLADAVVPVGGTPAGGELAHRAAVALAPALEAEPAAETREVLVYDSEMRLMALPPGLPEWRGAGRGGLAAVDGRLVLEHTGQGRLYAPLWLDCDPRRIGRPLTWRQLTVADTRRILPPHQAAGFRVQVGHDQWLLYRALDVPRNRTLLGCNVSSGFLLGRIRRSGAVARTVEIE